MRMKTAVYKRLNPKNYNSAVLKYETRIIANIINTRLNVRSLHTVRESQASSCGRRCARNRPFLGARY